MTKEAGSAEAGLDGRLKMLEDRLDDLNNRLKRAERSCDRKSSYRWAVSITSVAPGCYPIPNGANQRSHAW